MPGVCVQTLDPTFCPRMAAGLPRQGEQAEVYEHRRDGSSDAASNIDFMFYFFSVICSPKVMM